MLSGGSRNWQAFQENPQHGHCTALQEKNLAALQYQQCLRPVVWDMQLWTKQPLKTATLQNTGQKSHAAFHQIITHSLEEPTLTNTWALPVKSTGKPEEGVYTGVIYTSNSFASSPHGPVDTREIFPPSFFQYNCVHFRTSTNLTLFINDVGGCFRF